MAALVAAALAAAAVVLYFSRSAPRGVSVEDSSAGAFIHRMQSGNLEIAVGSPTGALSQGRSSFFIEFRDASSGELVDAGTVRATAAMAMPGMVMSGGVGVEPTGAPGRYRAVGEFGMAGAWRMTIEWEGPAGSGSVSFEGTVH